MEFYKVFLSSFSVCCRCLALILIPVRVPGKEMQGHCSQKPLPLLLLLSAVSAVSGDSPVSVSGFLGEQVVLPCIYKGKIPVSDLLVIWGRRKTEIVHKFVYGNDNLREQDTQFINRTNLFKDQLEKGNWSVLISVLRETDQDEYHCQIFCTTVGVYWAQTEIVHLSVKGSCENCPHRGMKAAGNDPPQGNSGKLPFYR
ncbi:CD276 antigen homolog [Stegostoma tigrinum]|uniref:CD276 antigen homolog n=1 Tax=Stegostoma tigrinum TaxID=3053191 RepID=UPI00286FD72D|nr:CD276 antigen homolog [Stegostoma tigrinum]